MDCSKENPRRACMVEKERCQIGHRHPYSLISRIILLLCLLVVPLSTQPVSAGTDTYHLSLPNTDTGFERVLGVGVAFPYPYFQRPAYRYPVYDREGRGSLLYGYGGDEVYPYRTFDPVEGHHKK